MPSVAEWKIALSAYKVFTVLWKEKKEAAELAYKCIEEALRDEPREAPSGLDQIDKKIERLEKRIENLTEMRADGELSKDEYLQAKNKAAVERDELIEKKKAALEGIQEKPDTDTILSNVKAALSKSIDFSSGIIPDEIIQGFVVDDLLI